MKQSICIVSIQHDQVFINGVKSGFVFTDPDEDGTFLNLTGAAVKKFRNRNNLTLWLLKNASRYFPQVLVYLLQHVERFPIFKYAA